MDHTPPSPARAVYEIDGERFSTLEEFYAEVSRVLVPGADWGRSLSAFNELLSGGLGAPAAGFTLRWKNHARSVEQLGRGETLRQLERALERARPEHRADIADELELARRGEGTTVYEWLVEIIRHHAPAGGEPASGIMLELC
jgi:RNAse (barnase) inhibitor barstar